MTGKTEPTARVRVLRLCLFLARDVIRGYTLAEVVDGTGWNKSNVYRDLEILLTEGFVTRDENNFYKLSPTWHGIALRFTEQMGQAQQRINEITLGVQARARQI